MVINKGQKVYPHELATWKIMPAVKAEVARRLSGEGYSNAEISRLLDSAQSCISQYIHGQRGNGFEIPKSVDPMFREFINMLKKDNSDEVMFYGVAQICNEIMRQHYGWDKLD